MARMLPCCRRPSLRLSLCFSRCRFRFRLHRHRISRYRSPRRSSPPPCESALLFIDSFFRWFIMSSSAVLLVFFRSPVFFSLCDSDKSDDDEGGEEEGAEDGSFCKMRDDTGKGFGEFSAARLPGGSGDYDVGPSAKKKNRRHLSRHLN